MLRALNAVVDHLAEQDTQKGRGLSHFVPLLKKALAVVFIIMAVRGLSFAFPTQTLHVEDEVAQKLAGAKPAVLGS